MALTKEQINGLNRINSSAQRVGLGDILARIEKSVLETQEESAIDLLRKEIDEIQGSIDKLLGLITKNSKAIDSVNNKLSKPKPKSKQKVSETP